MDQCAVWRGIPDKIVIRSRAVRHYIVLHGYVPGDTLSYPICCLIVMAISLCHGCQLSRIIREIQDLRPHLSVSRLESQISRIIAKFAVSCETRLSQQ